MNSDEKTRQKTVEKIALAAILALSLLAARLIVGLRTVIRMSPPIELKQSGLSVSMPSGNGWQCDNKWIYENSGFIVRSIFVTGGLSQSYAHCRYLLAVEPNTPKERFEKQADEFNGEVIQTGQLSSNQLKIEWAKIIRYVHGPVSDEMAERHAETYALISGICSLPGGRQLEIEVLTTEEEKEMIFSVFEHIVKDIRFDDNGLLQAGAATILETKQNGIDEYFALQSREKNLINFFIILDKQEHEVGFTMDAAAPGNESTPLLKIITYFYQKGLVATEQVGQFTGDGSPDNFNWDIRTNSSRGSKAVEMTCKDGLLKLRTSINDKVNEHFLGNTAVPDALVDLVFYTLLDSPRQEIIIDLIRLDGAIAPIYIKKITPSANGQSSAYAIRLEYLDGSGVWQQIYYDQAKRAVKKTLWQDGSFIFQQATAEHTAQVFPQRADVINNPFGFAEKEI